MTELERALLALEVEWPATPDLAASVRAELERPAPRRRLSLRRRLAIALASVLVVAGGTLVVSPAARSAVWRWLGLESVEIRRQKPTATPVPRSELGHNLGLGVPISLERARRAGALVPTGGLPEPTAYLGPVVGGRRTVALLYPPTHGLRPSKVTGAGLLVQTFHAQLDKVLLKKMSMMGTVESLSVGDAPAYWISGPPHGFQYATPEGGGFVAQRLADHTLLVERGGKLLRIEGAIGRDRALELAAGALR